MKIRGEKIKFCSWTRRWALTTGMALMLVVSPQVWAGIACLYDLQFECKESCCLTAHHHDAAAEMEGEYSSSETSTSVENTSHVADAAQVITQPQRVAECCVLQPQSEPPAPIVPAAPQISAMAVQSADNIFWPTTQALEHYSHPICRSSKHPLYLAFSCFLI